MTPVLREAGPGDAASICRIYNHYVERTTVTFEETPIAPEQMTGRIIETTKTLPWIVAEDDGQVIGYSYAMPWRTRSAYRFSVETSVYVDAEARQRGVGRLLYGALLPRLTGGGIRAVIGGITLPNEPSVALHERFGFTKVAHFSEVGWKFGSWLDVGYWELILKPAG